MIPSNKVENHAYLNLGNLEFERDPMSGLEAPSFSNGAAYGDLDNDGDLDLIVNNVNMISFVYENKSNENKSNNFLKIILKGSNKNLDGIGAQITVKSEQRDYYI